jgi:calcium-dependent protein kinase
LIGYLISYCTRHQTEKAPSAVAIGCWYHSRSKEREATEKADKASLFGSSQHEESTLRSSMGCGASSPEAVVAVEAPPPSTGALNGSSHIPDHSRHSTRSTKSNNHHGERVALNDVGSGRVALNDVGGGRVALNDVGGGRPHSPGDQRMRFASYASGASTPNTSSGNISWDGSSEEPVGEGTISNKEILGARSPQKLKHSGSAIGLDELRTDGAGLSSKVVHIEVPFGKPIEEVYDGVHDGPVLGSGVSGLVRLATHIATGVKYAVKCLDLGLVGTKAGLEQLREEIFIMCQLDHPNIVRLEEVYESHSEIYLVQELCLGGELFDRLDDQPDYHYTESECARLVKQMLSSVRYLHSKGIIHRDLKLENFLFSSTAIDSELKMIDFGLSKHFRFGEVHHEAVGTPYTVAPEVIRGTYDERCDIWAIGVITFLLLSGDPPFGGCGGPEPLLTVRSNILRGDYKFEPEDVWSLVSDKAKEFIKSMLVIDPKHRPTARDAQKHTWLREWASRLRKHDDNMLSPNVVKALVTFKEFSDMRKLLCEVLSFTLLPDQIKDLRKEFEKMDTDGSGEISLAALKQVLMINAGAGSLGALTEEEVEDIFNAMRVKKTETRIHWHEFIAAGLSQCQVDDRNLRLAFDRLDSDHKGVSYLMTTCCGDHL